MTKCSCWVKYPNDAHKKDSGKWNCVDCYKCIRNYDGKRKTVCEKIEGKPDRGRKRGGRMKLVIKINEARFKDIQRIAEVQLEMSHFPTAEQIIAKGVPIEQEPSITWVTGADGAKIAFWDVPVCKVTKICEILGEPQESEVKE